MKYCAITSRPSSSHPRRRETHTFPSRREPRRLGVEEEEPARVASGHLGAGDGAQEIQPCLEGSAEWLAAVPVGERELAPDDQHRALAGVVEFAAQDFVAGRGGARRPRCLDAPEMRRSSSSDCAVAGTRQPWGARSACAVPSPCDPPR